CERGGQRGGGERGDGAGASVAAEQRGGPGRCGYLRGEGDERRSRVAEAGDLVDLGEAADRPGTEESGCRPAQGVPGYPLPPLPALPHTIMVARGAGQLGALDSSGLIAPVGASCTA